MDKCTKELVQVAAAFALGCQSCLEQHLPLAKECGASEQDIQDVFAMVRSVRLSASIAMDDFIGHLDSPKKVLLTMATSQQSSCGCESGDCC